jgi:hypothetical protein
VQEKNPLKALNSFAIGDIIDGVDAPMLTAEASVAVGVKMSFWIVQVHVSGGFALRVGEFTVLETTFNDIHALY